MIKRTDYDEKVRELHAQGLSDPEISKALNGEISSRRVQEVRAVHLKLAPNFDRSIVRYKIDRDYLIREFDESMKALQAHGDRKGVVRHMKRVAAELGASYEAVKRVYVNELALVKPAEPPAEVTDEQYAEAKRLLVEHDMPYSEVSKVTGISTDRLSRKFPGMGASPSDARRIGWAKEMERQMGIAL